MISTAWKHLRRYGAILELAPKLFVAYRAWFWMHLFVHILALAIFVYFWRAVYADRSTLGGLALEETVNYIMLAQVMLPIVLSFLVMHIGEQLVSGQFAMELLRPLDLQARFYAESLAFALIALVTKVPLAIFAWLVFGLELPSDPSVWGAFLLALLFGHAVIFCFDWIFACLAFYSTESWGLAMAQQAVVVFFSGALVPLTLMPDWLERLALSMPFAQALYVPVSILSGITPLEDVPRLWTIQLLWLVGLLVVSRLVFRVAVRKVTVQGG
jgi:ABC-2 type transport system permease protein